MSLWNMSISGGVFIAAIIIIRSLFRNRLPGAVFRVLWLAVFLRLMIPFSIPCPFSVYSLAESVGLDFSDRKMSEAGLLGSVMSESEVSGTAVSGNEISEDGMKAELWDISLVWNIVYLGGVILCVLYYVSAYVKWHREFGTSFPIEEPNVQAWADGLPIRRRVSVRQWERAVTPLTYGILHPVILLPKSLGKAESEQSRFVLLHEYMHIRHFDALKKIFLALVCCIHWFNPLVWVMCTLANRDMEIDCDESVIKYLGRDMRSAYAYTLIELEEQKGIRISWGNSFGRNAMEERVVAIMKGTKKSIAAGVLSGILTAGIIMAFATSAFAIGGAERENYAEAEEGTVQATYDIEQVTAVSTDDEETTYIVGKEEQVNEIHVNEAVADSSVATEGESNSILEVPSEYASYGIASNPKTGGWEYQGKQVAVFYDKGRYTLTNDASGKNAAYLEVCRDKKGKIEEIKELSKEQMQKVLSQTGLVF